MPTPTYDLIASTTLAASTSSVVFGSLPQTYRDLILVMNGSPSTNDYPTLSSRLNGDSGANYSRVRMYGTGSGTSSSSATGQTGLELGSYTGIGSSTTSRSHVIAQLMDYSATDKHKTVLVRNGTNTEGVEAIAGRWANTSAVTSWEIFVNVGGFAAGFTFNLYGVIS
jgi:hypothetical protein